MEGLLLVADEADAGKPLLSYAQNGCPGCGVELHSSVLSLDSRYNASCACLNLFNELTAFTLVNAGKDFIHQISLDAYTAQHTGAKIKPIGISFALIGLYLAFERGYTGRQVQLAHMALAKTRRDWPLFETPKAKAEITVADVVNGLTAAITGNASARGERRFGRRGSRSGRR